MPNNKVKSLTRIIQERNSDMKYTQARRLAKCMPHLHDPRQNLLICGSAGSGGTVALKAFASRARDEGARIALISIKEHWSEWLKKESDVAVATMFESQLHNCEKSYVETLLSVEPGTKESPLFLGLDNFASVIVPEQNATSALEQYGGMEFLRSLIKKNPYTCVALRMQVPHINILPPDLNRNMGNRLWMGRGNSFVSKIMFGHEFSCIKTTECPQGRGFLQQYDTDLEVVDIPFDPAIQGL